MFKTINFSLNVKNNLNNLLNNYDNNQSYLFLDLNFIL